MTRVHLRRRVQHQGEPERRETVRRKRHDLRDQAVLERRTSSARARQANRWAGAVVGDRWLEVRAGHQAAKATELFSAQSPRDPQPEHRFTACGHPGSGGIRKVASVRMMDLNARSPPLR